MPYSLPVTCLTLSGIAGSDCIGDTRSIINDNAYALGTALCTLSSNTVTLSTTSTVQHTFINSTRLLASDVRNLSINTRHLANDSVTTAKISAEAVTTDKIALSAITTDKIALSAVTQDKIAVNVAGTGPAFRAYSSVNTSVPQGISTKVTLDVIQYNVNNNFSSSRFTPTIPGYYQINFHIRMEAKQDAWALLLLNGSLFSSGSVPSGLNYISTASDIVYLNGTTDYVELFAVHQSAGSQNVTAAVMSGFLARSA